MSRKRVSFAAEDDVEPTDDELLADRRKQARFDKLEDSEKGDASKSKHTLESDEEEDEKYDRLDMNALDGEEDETIEFDGTVLITPFNMKEEMGDGHFDSDGHFIFNKRDAGEIKDAWMDGIDWANVKQAAGRQWQRHKQEDDSDSDEEPNSLSCQEKQSIYEQMMSLMRTGETVAKALRRLGGSKKSIRERQCRGRPQVPGTVSREVNIASSTSDQAPSSSTEAIGIESDRSSRSKADKSGHIQSIPDQSQGDDIKPSVGGGEGSDETKDLLRLTGLVDDLVSNGQMDAYEYTYEKLSFDVRSLSRDNQDDSSSTPTTDQNKLCPVDGLTVPHEASNNKQDASFDMFADDEETTAEGSSVTNQSTQQFNDDVTGIESKNNSVTNGTKDSSDGHTKCDSDEVTWMFKWKVSDVDCHGPCTSGQMLEWTNAGYFKDGVVVRRADRPEAPFYSSQRVDFELFM